MVKEDKVKTIEIVDRLYESGDLRLLMSSGLIDPAVLKWRKIYHAYYKHLKEDKVKKRKCAEDIGCIFDCSFKTVYNVLNRMNFEIKKK